MYLVRNLSGLNTAVMTCSGSAMGLTWGDMCDVFIAFNSCLSAKMAGITCPTAHPARWGERRSRGSRAGGRDRPGGCPTWSYRWMPRKMSTTSWARPFTTSPMALPAAAASPATFCPAGVQRNTKRLPAANAAALAGSDGTATMSAGVGFVAGVGSGAVAMLYPVIARRLRVLNRRDSITKCHRMLFSFVGLHLLPRCESVQCPLNGRQHGFQIGKLLIGGFRLRRLRQIGSLDHPTAGLIEKGTRQMHDLFVWQQRANGNGNGYRIRRSDRHGGIGDPVQARGRQCPVSGSAGSVPVLRLYQSLRVERLVADLDVPLAARIQPVDIVKQATVLLNHSYGLPRI